MTSLNDQGPDANAGAQGTPLRESTVSNIDIDKC